MTSPLRSFIKLQKHSMWTTLESLKTTLIHSTSENKEQSISQFVPNARVIGCLMAWTTGGERDRQAHLLPFLRQGPSNRHDVGTDPKPHALTAWQRRRPRKSSQTRSAGCPQYGRLLESAQCGTRRWIPSPATTTARQWRLWRLTARNICHQTACHYPTQTCIGNQSSLLPLQQSSGSWIY